MSSYRASVILRRMERDSCLGKREHMSMREASNAAATVSSQNGERLIPYHCPFCRLFHVGHPKSWKRLRAERELKQYECDGAKRRIGLRKAHEQY